MTKQTLTFSFSNLRLNVLICFCRILRSERSSHGEKIEFDVMHCKDSEKGMLVSSGDVVKSMALEVRLIVLKFTISDHITPSSSFDVSLSFDLFEADSVRFFDKSPLAVMLMSNFASRGSMYC